MADGPSATHELLGDFAPALADLTERVLFGEIWTRPGFSPRDRSLVTVSALIAMSRTEQIGFHLEAALDNGVTFDELVEAVTHLAFYAGWPAAMSAITRLKDLADGRSR